MHYTTFFEANAIDHLARCINELIQQLPHKGGHRSHKTVLRMLIITEPTDARIVNILLSYLHRSALWALKAFLFILNNVDLYCSSTGLKVMAFSTECVHPFRCLYHLRQHLNIRKWCLRQRPRQIDSRQPTSVDCFPNAVITVHLGESNGTLTLRERFSIYDRNFLLQSAACIPTTRCVRNWAERSLSLA